MTSRHRGGRGTCNSPRPPKSSLHHQRKHPKMTALGGLANPTGWGLIRFDWSLKPQQKKTLASMEAEISGRIVKAKAGHLHVTALLHHASASRPCHSGYTRLCSLSWAVQVGPPSAQAFFPQHETCAERPLSVILDTAQHGNHR